LEDIGIEMYLSRIGWEDADWIHLAYENGNEPLGSIKGRGCLD